MKKNFIFILFVFLCVFIKVYSQIPVSTKGNKYILAWPSIGGKDSSYCHFSIFSHGYQLNGKIYSLDSLVNLTISTVRGKNQNHYYWISINDSTYPKDYFNRFLVTNSEVIENKGMFVDMQDSVSFFMYAYNHSRFYNTSPPPTKIISEFTHVYPIEALGEEYVIVTKSEENYPSQFLIVSAEDSTELEIVTTQITEKGKLSNTPFTVMLNRGQTYLIRSLSGDLTGSLVKSNGKKCKKFAVFVGTPLTTVDASSNPNTNNRNTLLEHLPPNKLLGNKYVTPFISGSIQNLIRIVSIKDSTLIFINGSQFGTYLMKGQYFDLHTDSSLYISSANSILVSQFSKSSQNSFPTMLILQPLNQMNEDVDFPEYSGSASVLSNAQVKTVIITKFENRMSTIVNGKYNFYQEPWKVVFGNPEYVTTVFKNDINRPNYISNSKSGILAYQIGLNDYQGFSLSSGASFNKFIYSYIDTVNFHSNSNYCQNSISKFSAISDTLVTSFYWMFGDGGVAVGKTVDYMYKNPGLYSVKLVVYRESFCAYDTVRKTITVHPTTTVKVGSRPKLTLCKGETVVIGSSNDNTMTYSWSPSIGLSDTSKGQTNAIVFIDTITYILKGVNKFGCVSIDSITIVMYNQPIANAGPDTVSCGGNGVQIGRQTTGGTPNYSFLWTPADGLSNDKIERPIAAPSTNTTYILRVTDANGCIAYDTVNIQALPSPTIDAGNPATICEGDSVQLNATGANQFRWVNARNINDTTIGNPTVYPTVTTTYYVAGLFPTGCVAFDSVLVTVTPKPRLPIAFQTTACPNATKTYTVENRNDLTYSWEITGGNLTSGQGSNEATVTWGAGPTGSIKLTTTTTAGLCTFDTIVNITISSDIKPTITENKKNTIIPSLGTVRICPNESVTLDVGVGYTEITWTNGSNTRQTTVNTEGWVGVQVKDATGCSGGDSVFVEVVPPPTVFAGNDRVLCGADTAVMRPTVTGSGTYTYQWIPPTAVSDPTSLVTNFIAPTTTNLIFQAIDTANGCITSDTVLMTILTLAGDFITTSKGNNILCFGEQMTLDAGAFDSYTWSTGETTRTITINNGGSYWVDAKSGSCSAIDTIQIIQNPQIVVIPTPDITASPGATVTLDANATGGTLPYQFQWTPNVNFVDPTTVQSPRVTASVGSQSYIVTITDANGCTARDTITVFVPSTATTVAIARREVSATAFGERFPITLTLDPNTPITPTGFTATVTVPFEQFIPKSVSNGTMTVTQNATDYVVNITVPINEPLYNNSVITELVGDILLGQQDSTPIVISNAQWTGTTYPVTTQNGRIVLNDVCYSGTRRYLLPTTVGFGIMSVHPNPSNTKATFEFGIIEAGQTTFEIIDVFGNVVHSTSWNRQPSTPKGGTDDSRTTHTVDVSNLPSGTYYGVLKSFSQRESVPLVITR